MIAEVIESHGCHAKHRVGDRFVMTAGGQLIADECPKGMCVSAVAEISKVLPAIYERLINKTDPQFERKILSIARMSAWIKADGGKSL